MGTLSKFDVGDSVFAIMEGNGVIGPVQVLEVELQICSDGAIKNERYLIESSGDKVLLPISRVAASRPQAEEKLLDG